MWNKKISINRDTLLYITLLYLYLPVVIFFYTWLKVWIAIPMMIICVWILYRFSVHLYQMNEEEKLPQIKIHIGLVAASLLLMLLWGYYMGWSGGAPQAADWSKHNAVLRDLINYEWPVYYHAAEPAMLTYYIGQYIIPAFAGKLCGSFEAAQIVMYVWNCLGIVIIVYWLFLVTGAATFKKQLLAVCIFMFFGGLLPVAQIILTQWKGYPIGSQFDIVHFLNIDEYLLQYRNNLTNMRWTFPQCSAAWICILLFMHYHKCKIYYAAILFPGMLFGTMAFLGLVLIAAADVIVDFILSKSKKSMLRELFSIENLLMILLPGGILLAYLSGNVFSEKPAEIGLSFVHYSGKNILVYLVFCICSFGVYAACIFKAYRKQPLFIIILILLCVFPFMKMGVWNDLCMNISTPAFFVLMIYVLKYIFEHAAKWNEKFTMGILAASLFIGALYPIMELYGCIRDNEWGIKQMQDVDYSLAQYADRDQEEIALDQKYNYYTYDPQEHFFIKYLARRRYE